MKSIAPSAFIQHSDGIPPHSLPYRLCRAEGTISCNSLFHSNGVSIERLNSQSIMSQLSAISSEPIVTLLSQASLRMQAASLLKEFLLSGLYVIHYSSSPQI